MKKSRVDRPIRILVLAADLVGANCTSDENKLSILEKFRRYGWKVTLAGAQRTVPPCAYYAQRGGTSLELDATLDEIGDVLEYDGISILPGPSHAGLLKSPKALQMIRDAVAAGLVVSAWCHGVRVLAAADVVRGKRIVGHATDRDIVEAAGGIFVGHDHPPVTDGRLVTGARSYYYRAKNADAIRSAILQRLSDEAAQLDQSG